MSKCRFLGLVALTTILVGGCVVSIANAGTAPAPEAKVTIVRGTLIKPLEVASGDLRKRGRNPSEYAFFISDAKTFFKITAHPVGESDEDYGGGGFLYHIAKDNLQIIKFDPQR